MLYKTFENSTFEEQCQYLNGALLSLPPQIHSILQEIFGILSLSERVVYTNHLLEYGHRYNIVVQAQFFEEEFVDKPISTPLLEILFLTINSAPRMSPHLLRSIHRYMGNAIPADVWAWLYGELTHQAQLTSNFQYQLTLTILRNILDLEIVPPSLERLDFAPRTLAPMNSSLFKKVRNPVTSTQNATSISSTKTVSSPTPTNNSISKPLLTGVAAMIFLLFLLPTWTYFGEFLGLTSSLELTTFRTVLYSGGALLGFSFLLLYYLKYTSKWQRVLPFLKGKFKSRPPRPLEFHSIGIRELLGKKWGKAGVLILFAVVFIVSSIFLSYFGFFLSLSLLAGFGVWYRQQGVWKGFLGGALCLLLILTSAAIFTPNILAPATRRSDATTYIQGLETLGGGYSTNNLLYGNIHDTYKVVKLWYDGGFDESLIDAETISQFVQSCLSPIGGYWEVPSLYQPLSWNTTPSLRTTYEAVRILKMINATSALETDLPYIHDFVKERCAPLRWQTLLVDLNENTLIGILLMSEIGNISDLGLSPLTLEEILSPQEYAMQREFLLSNTSELYLAWGQTTYDLQSHQKYLNESVELLQYMIAGLEVLIPNSTHRESLLPLFFDLDYLVDLVLEWSGYDARQHSFNCDPMTMYEALEVLSKLGRLDSFVHESNYPHILNNINSNSFFKTENVDPLDSLFYYPILTEILLENYVLNYQHNIVTPIISSNGVILDYTIESSPVDATPQSEPISESRIDIWGGVVDYFQTYLYWWILLIGALFVGLIAISGAKGRQQLIGFLIIFLLLASEFIVLGQLAVNIEGQSPQINSYMEPLTTHGTSSESSGSVGPLYLPSTLKVGANLAQASSLALNTATSFSTAVDDYVVSRAWSDIQTRLHSTSEMFLRQLSHWDTTLMAAVRIDNTIIDIPMRRFMEIQFSHLRVAELGRIPGSEFADFDQDLQTSGTLWGILQSRLYSHSTIDGLDDFLKIGDVQGSSISAFRFFEQAQLHAQMRMIQIYQGGLSSPLSNPLNPIRMYDSALADRAQRLMDVDPELAERVLWETLRPQDGGVNPILNKIMSEAVETKLKTAQQNKAEAWMTLRNILGTGLTDQIAREYLAGGDLRSILTSLRLYSDGDVDDYERRISALEKVESRVIRKLEEAGQMAGDALLIDLNLRRMDVRAALGLTPTDPVSLDMTRTLQYGRLTFLVEHNDPHGTRQRLQSVVFVAEDKEGATSADRSSQINSILSRFHMSEKSQLDRSDAPDLFGVIWKSPQNDLPDGSYTKSSNSYFIRNPWKPGTASGGQGRNLPTEANGPDTLTVRSLGVWSQEILQMIIPYLRAQINYANNRLYTDVAWRAGHFTINTATRPDYDQMRRFAVEFAWAGLRLARENELIQGNDISQIFLNSPRYKGFYEVVDGEVRLIEGKGNEFTPTGEDFIMTEARMQKIIKESYKTQILEPERGDQYTTHLPRDARALRMVVLELQNYFIENAEVTSRIQAAFSLQDSADMPLIPRLAGQARLAEGTAGDDNTVKFILATYRRVEI